MHEISVSKLVMGKLNSKVPVHETVLWSTCYCHNSQNRPKDDLIISYDLMWISLSCL